MTEIPASFSPLSRLQSGVPGLDAILQGGLPTGSVYILMGSPGTGKTILANQMAFHHLQDHGRVVYVSLLAEEHPRLFSHLASLSFFDGAQVGERIFYYGGYEQWATQGLGGLLIFLRRIVREKEATLLVLDGFGSTQEWGANKLEQQHFFQGLQVALAALHCTALLLSHLTETSAAERTMVDGLIELFYPLVGMRSHRQLRVVKCRGTGFLEGLHTFRIGQDGLRIFPRTEALLCAEPQETPEERRRLSLGVPQLDAMLRGGVLARSSTVLLGVPGTGKTLLGMHFLNEGAARGEPGLHLSFYEQPQRLIQKGQQVGLATAQHVEAGRLTLLWQRAVENDLDVLATNVLEVVRERGVQRLFLDGLRGFVQAATLPERLPGFAASLFRELRAMGVTLLVVEEMNRLFGDEVKFSVNGIDDVADNIILLRYVELNSQLYRLISILKARESDYDMVIRAFRISPQGIEVADTFHSAEAILTGIARPSTPVYRGASSGSNEATG